MQIVACQLDIVWENKPANHDRVRAMLASIAIKPGDLIVLPEMFATGYSMNVAAIAEPPGGETQQFLAGLAKDRQCFVMGGVAIRGRDGDKTYRTPIVVEKNCTQVMAVNNFLGRGSDGNFEMPKGNGTASGNVMV